MCTHMGADVNPSYVFRLVFTCSLCNLFSTSCTIYANFENKYLNSLILTRAVKTNTHYRHAQVCACWHVVGL